MRSGLNRDIGGAPLWLLVLAPILVVAVVVVTVAGGLKPRAASAGPLPAFTPVPYSTPSTFPLPGHPRLLVIGGTTTRGSAASPVKQGYAYLVGSRLGWKTTVKGIDGTGFITGGADGAAGEYRARIRAYIAAKPTAPDVIVLEGTPDDAGSVGTVTATVVTDVGRLKKAFPDAVVVLLGPAAPQPFQARLGTVDAADAVAARQLDIPFISPYQEHWFTTANSPRYASSDGAHFDTAGHRYLATRFLADFTPLFGLE